VRGKEIMGGKGGNLTGGQGGQGGKTGLEQKDSTAIWGLDNVRTVCQHFARHVPAALKKIEICARNAEGVDALVHWVCY
jgi:hypothetical protein